jgi:hypothetical protein
MPDWREQGVLADAHGTTKHKGMVDFVLRPLHPERDYARSLASPENATGGIAS